MRCSRKKYANDKHLEWEKRKDNDDAGKMVEQNCGLGGQCRNAGRGGEKPGTKQQKSGQKTEGSREDEKIKNKDLLAVGFQRGLEGPLWKVFLLVLMPCAARELPHKAISLSF